jgi:murein DD-endopeptidase MepM/ murein hydrolase activator NlpD
MTLKVTIEQRKEKYAEFEKFLDDQKMLLASTPSIWPTRGWLSSRFGYRTSPFADKKEFHRGIDISARSGSPIISPANGLVVFNGWKRAMAGSSLLSTPEVSKQNMHT